VATRSGRKSAADAALRGLIGALDAQEVSRQLLRAALQLAGAHAGEVVLCAADGAEEIGAQRGPRRALEESTGFTLPLRARGTLFGRLRVRGERPRSVERRRELSELAGAGARALAAAASHAAALRRAELDPLTGLANRGRFWELLEHEVTRAARYGRALSLVLFDIDGLKRVNDRHGHLAGDEALLTTARLVRERSRASDTAARYGGDELVLVLPETPPAGALLVAEKIRASIEANGPEATRVTVSAGVASAPGDGQSAREIVAVADARLYAAKAAGKNRVAGAG
jgi:diguanylate cyclase (GGDEF)-like protein